MLYPAELLSQKVSNLKITASHYLNDVKKTTSWNFRLDPNLTDQKWDIQEITKLNKFAKVEIYCIKNNQG
jgi:Holliday junction resolvase-like predicted endonuclease